MQRPRPPEALLGSYNEPFAPAPDVLEWIRGTFIEGDGPLVNPDHTHLAGARIGVLWAACENSRHMKAIVGQAEMPTFQGNKWTKARQEQQMFQWFGELPDFVLTFDAHYSAQCDDRQFCRLVEHELYHCSQALNEFGAPKFRRDGTAVFAIRGHDIEEFLGVIKRYGATELVQDVVNAAQGKHIDPVHIDGACGTCRALNI